MLLWWLPIAEAEDDWLGHSALAQGAAVVAAPREVAATAVNPAAMALAPFYDGGLYGSLGTDFGWGGAAVDAESLEGVAIGVSARRSYTRVPWTDENLPGWLEGGELPSNKLSTREAQLALAVPFFERRLSLGLSGMLSRYDSDRYGAGWTGDIDVGLAALPHRRLAVGLVARNLLPFDAPRTTPMGFLGGVRLRDDEDLLGFEVDAGVSLATEGWDLDLRAGGSARIGELELRAGWRLAGAHFVTAGIGWHNDAGSVGYALSVPIAPFDLATQTHMLGVTLHIPAQGDPW